MPKINILPTRQEVQDYIIGGGLWVVSLITRHLNSAPAITQDQLQDLAADVVLDRQGAEES